MEKLEQGKSYDTGELAEMCGFDIEGVYYETWVFEGMKAKVIAQDEGNGVAKVLEILRMGAKIGEKLVATERIGYFMGQVEDDCISEGEVVTVDGIKDGDVYVHEHADRYGPYPIDSFRLATQEEIEQDYLDNNADQVRIYN